MAIVTVGIDLAKNVFAGAWRGSAPDAQQIPLFVSHARGDADAGSDLDFLVIESTVENRAKEMVRARRALRPLRVSVDVLVYSTRGGRALGEATRHCPLLGAARRPGSAWMIR